MMLTAKVFDRHPAIVGFCQRLGWHKCLRKKTLYLWKDQILVRITLSRDARNVYFDIFLLDLEKRSNLNSLLARSGLVKKPPAAYQSFMQGFAPILSESEGLAYEKNLAFYLHMTETVFCKALEAPSEELLATCFSDTEERKTDFLKKLVSGVSQPVYFILGVSHDPEMMGCCYPLINGLEGEKELSPQLREIYKGYGLEPLPEDLDMNRFLMRVAAKDVDFYSSAYLKNKGFFISERLSQHIPNYQLQNCRLQGLEVNRAYPEKRSLQFCHIPEGDEFIDFGMSTFHKKPDGKEPEEVTFCDGPTCLREVSRAVNDQLPYRITPKRLYFHHYPDLTWLSIYPVFLISEDFSELLRAQGMTGYTLTKPPFEIF